MRLLTLLLLCLCAMAPGISADNGGGITTGTGGGVASDSGCSMGAPLVWFDARSLSGANYSKVSAWANSGSGSATYDLAQATGADQPRLRAAGTCSGGATAACVDMVDASDWMLGGNGGGTWTVSVQCMTAFLPSEGATTRYPYTYGITGSAEYFWWTPDDARFIQTAGAPVIGTIADGGWHTICLDVSDPTGPVYMDGTELIANAGLGAYVAPNGFAIGSRDGTSFGSGDEVELGQLAFYNAAPEETLAELSACGQELWGFPDPPADPAIFLPADYYGTTTHSFDLMGRTTTFLADPTTAAYAFSSTAPSSSSSDKLTITPATSGEYTLSVSITPSGGSLETQSAALHVVTPTIQSAYNVMLVGDSLTQHQTYPSRVATRINGYGGSLIGSYGTAGAKHTGVSGWDWGTFADAGISPFFNGGASLDIPGYLTALGASPDVVVWLLGTNQMASTSAVSEYQMQRELRDYAQLLVDEWPSGAIHVIALTLPANYDDDIALWTAPATRIRFRERQHNLVQAFNRQFKGQPNVYILATHTAVDPTTDYVDALHPTLGYDKLGDSVSDFILWAAETGAF